MWHLIFDLLFSLPIKQQKNFLWLATKSANHLDRASPIYFTLYNGVILYAQPLSFERNWFRSYSSAYCDWSQSSSNPLRMDFKPLPPNFFFESLLCSSPGPRGRTDAWYEKKGLETNHLCVFLYIAKIKSPKGLLFSKQG